MTDYGPIIAIASVSAFVLFFVWLFWWVVQPATQVYETPVLFKNSDRVCVVELDGERHLVYDCSLYREGELAQVYKENRGFWVAK